MRQKTNSILNYKKIRSIERIFILDLLRNWFPEVGFQF